MARFRRAAGRIGAAVALVCGAVALPAPAPAAGPEAIVGYGPLQFGMTMAEVMKAVPHGRLKRCDFPDHFPNCIEYDDKAFGMPAIVRARFGADQKLDGVFVQYDRLGAPEGSRACRTTVTAALKRLRDDYGPPWQPEGYAAAMLRGDATAAGAGRAKPDAKTKPEAKAKDAAKPAAGKAAAVKDGKAAAATAPAGANDAAPPPDLVVWFGAKAGKLGLADLCRGDDTGVVYVIFTPSSVPGGKAS